MNSSLPALPGGVGPSSDALAALSRGIADRENIISEIRTLYFYARRNRISLPRDIRRETARARRDLRRELAIMRLKLWLMLNRTYCGEKETCLEI